KIGLVSVKAYHIFYLDGDAVLLVRFPFRQIDDQVVIEDALADEIPMRALAMIAARNRRAVIVDGEFLRLIRNCLEMAARAEFNFAIAARIAMLAIGWDEKVVFVMANY